LTLTLHLGVVEQPYNDPEGTTTGDVAEILEARYGVMQAFVNAHRADIANDLAEGVAGALETVLAGGPMSNTDPFAAGLAKVEQRFKDFLSSGEIEAWGVPGVPTEASIKRRSARFKAGKSDRPRPSFIDTGLYEASFKAWIDSGAWMDAVRDAAQAGGGAA